MLRISGSEQILMTKMNNIYGIRLLKTLRIGIMNVATLREKEEELIEVMKIRKLSITAVCETRMRSNGDRVIHEGYRLIYSGGEQARHGVAFLLEASIAQFVEKVIPINERLIGVDLKLMDGVSMIQVYAPQQGRPAAEKNEFYQHMIFTHRGYLCMLNPNLSKFFQNSNLFPWQRVINGLKVKYL